MEDLKDVIREIKSYKEISPSDDMILDCSTRIFISNNIQKEKGSQEQKATDKQKWMLKKLKIDFDDNITKREAFNLIKEKKEI